MCFRNLRFRLFDIMQRTSELRSGGLGRLETPSLQDSVSIPRQLSDRVSQLIQVIQPSRASEDRRLAIADYVRRLIVKCFQPDHKVTLKTRTPE